MIKHYETLLLMRTDTTDEKISGLEKNLAAIISEFGGKTTLFDNWGKYRLAYPIGKDDYGVYALTRYTISKSSATDFFQKFNTFLKVRSGDFVIRFVNVLLDEATASAPYKKPSQTPDNSSVDSKKMFRFGFDVGSGFGEDEAAGGEVLGTLKLQVDELDEMPNS